MARTDGDTLTAAEAAALERARTKVGGKTRAPAGSRSRPPAKRARKSSTPRRPSRAPKKPKRIASLDAYRGLVAVATVLWLAAGDRAAMPALLQPAGWHGFEAADIVAPMALLAMGAGLHLRTSAQKRLPRNRRLLRLIRRVVVLVGLGLGIAAIAYPGWDYLQITGVLPRLALAYALAWVIVTRLPLRGQIIAAGVILLGHWIVLTRIGAGLGPETNAAAAIDRALLGAPHIAPDVPTDPHGLLSIPAVAVVVVAGAWFGAWLQQRPTGPATAVATSLVGLYAAVAGIVAAQLLPLNRTLWTSSWTLFGTGAGLLVFAAVYVLVDVLPTRWATRTLIAMGRNALAIFVTVAGAVAALGASRPDSAWRRGYAALAEHVGLEAAALLMAIAALTVAAKLAKWLDRHGWYLTA